MIELRRTVMCSSCCCCFSHSACWLPNREKLLYTVDQYIGEMDSRFWNGLSAGFRRFWKQRLPIEIFRIQAYMTVVGLPSALKKYVLKLCTSLSRNEGIQPKLGGYSRILKYLKPFTSSITMEIHELFNDWGGRGYDDSVPGEVIKTAPSGDRTT